MAEPNSQVGGYFPRDLYNFGSGPAQSKNERSQPQFTQRVVAQDDRGQIVWWRAIISDVRGGVNQLDGKFEETFDRIASGSADGRFHRTLILPHLVDTQSSPAPSSSFVGIHSVMYDNMLHIGAGAGAPATVDFVTSAGEQGVTQIYQITGWHGSAAPEDGTAATGTSATPDPPSLTPSWGSAATLWLTGFGVDNGGAATFASSAPTDYGNAKLKHSAIAAGGVAVNTARRELTGTVSDPGTFAPGVNEEWTAQTVAVRPSGSSATEPTVAQVLEQRSSSGATTFDVAMPATVVSGELLLMIVGRNTSNTLTVTGFTRIVSMSEALDNGIEVWAKVADGTEDGTNVTCTSSTSCSWVVMTYHIQDWDGILGNGIEYSAQAYDVSSPYSAPNTASVTIPAGWDSSLKTLFISAVVQDVASTYTAPSGYTLGQQMDSTPSDISVAVAHRAVAAASENPGAWGSTGSDEWIGVTLAIKIAAPSTAYPQVASVTETVFNTDATAHASALPASSSGDLLVAFFVNDGNATVTTPSGWTLLDSTASGTAVRLSVYYKISTGGDSGTGTLFKEVSETDPTLELTQYAGQNITGLDLVVLDGAATAARLLVSRANAVMQLLASDYSVATSMHADTNPGWGAMQTFTNDDLVLLYCKGAIRYLRTTDASSTAPTIGISNVPNGGYPVGLIKLGGAPIRPVWVWPYEDNTASMLLEGSEAIGHVVSTNSETTDWQEVPMGIDDVHVAINVNGYAVCANNFKRVMLYDGSSDARDLLWASEREIAAGYELSCRGMACIGNEIWVETFLHGVEGSDPEPTVQRWFEVYNLETNAWHQVAESASLTTHSHGLIASGDLPFSSSTRRLHTYTDGWKRTYVPHYGYNPRFDNDPNHTYAASATYSSPSWELPGLEGWPKVISRIIFQGDVDSGGDSDDTDQYVTVTAGGVTATFRPGLSGRDQMWENPVPSDLFYRLQVDIDLARTASATTYTPNGLPVIIEGYCFIEAGRPPSYFMSDVR